MSDMNVSADTSTPNLDVADTNPQTIPGQQPGETQAQAAQRLFKVMVDGQEQEIDEDTLKKGYSHSAAANKRMQDAAMLRKEAEEVLRIFKSNPKEAFSKLGLDAKQFAEQLINEELEEALMDPKDRELRKYRTQVEQYEAQRRAAQEAYEKEQMESEIARQSDAIQSEIINTLDQSGLPKTERTVGRIVYYMQAALQAGYNVTPKDVIEHVRNDYIHDFKAMLGGLSEQQIEMFLGNDLVRKVAKSTVKQAAKENIVPKSVNQNRPKSEPQKKIQSPRDFFRRPQ